MKRPWKCIALLSLIPSQVSSLSQDARKKASKVDLDPLQQPISSGGGTPPSTKRKSSIVDQDLFAQVVVRKKKQRRKSQGGRNYNGNNDDKRRKSSSKRSPAPFVDSTLLRFISEQKKQSEATGLPPDDPLLRPYTIPRQSPSVVDDDKRRQNPTWEYLEGLQEDSNQQLSAEEKHDGINGMDKRPLFVAASAQEQPSAGAPTLLPTDVDITFSSSSWDMGQYNANRVAKLLMEDSERNSVPKALAIQAGTAVQTHVMRRTARRRVRDFLKRRDRMWAQTTTATATATSKRPPPSTPETSAERKTGTTSSPPQYGIKDVLRLLREKGLTTNDVALILCHTPSIALMMPTRRHGDRQLRLLPGDDDSVPVEGDGNSQMLLDGETLEETFERAFQHVLTDSLRLRNNMARKVLRTCPGMLTMRGSKRAEEVLTLLLSLGVSPYQMGKDPNSLPALLSRSPSALFRLVSFLTSDAIRMPVKSIGPMLRRRECRELLNAVSPNLLALTASNNATIKCAASAEDAATTYLLEDTIWVCDSHVRRKKIDKVYQRMRSTAWTLRYRIGTRYLTDVVLAYPSVLLLNAEEQVLPNAMYLNQELGIFKDDLPKVLRMFPTLLGTDIEEMQESVEFLRSLNIPDGHLTVIFKAFPKLLTMDVEKQMIPVVTFLADEVGVTNLGKFVARLPPILGYSIDRELRPKWQYLCKVCMHPVFEISRFPAYFSYPFDKRIKTRYEYLRFVKKNSQTPLMAVDAIVRYGDEDFAREIAKDRDGGKLLKRYIVYRDSKLASVEQQRRKAKSSGTSNKQQKGEKGERRIIRTKQQQSAKMSSGEKSSQKRPSSRQRPPKAGCEDE